VHEQQNGFLPTGGWGYWTGEPARGFDRRQPGSWLYNITPYMELSSLHDLGINDPAADVGAWRPGIAQCMATSVETFICPTRRRPLLYPLSQASGSSYPGIDSNCILKLAKSVGRSDYAASLGDGQYDAATTGMECGPQLKIGDTWINSGVYTKKYKDCAGSGVSGAVYRFSMVRLRDITDGASNTYFAGEKQLTPLHHTDGQSTTDDQSWNSSFCFDTTRWTGTLSGGTKSGGATAWVQYGAVGAADQRVAPAVDGDPKVDPNDGHRFGSAHANGFNMVFCDGSVHVIGYTIDPDTHHRLGNIADGQSVDAKAF
jgi:prepilin-type processing-associated H-X9-DG protein